MKNNITRELDVMEMVGEIAKLAMNYNLNNNKIFFNVRIKGDTNYLIVDVRNKVDNIKKTGFQSNLAMEDREELARRLKKQAQYMAKIFEKEVKDNG